MRLESNPELRAPIEEVCLNDPDPSLRANAAEALAQAYAPSSKKCIAEVLKLDPPPRHSYGQATIAICSQGQIDPGDLLSAIGQDVFDKAFVFCRTPAFADLVSAEAKRRDQEEERQASEKKRRELLGDSYVRTGPPDERCPEKMNDALPWIKRALALGWVEKGPVLTGQFTRFTYRFTKTLPKKERSPGTAHLQNATYCQWAAVTILGPNGETIFASNGAAPPF